MNRVGWEARRNHCEVLTGEAAGEKLGAYSVNRCVVNVGTVWSRPQRQPARSATGRTAVVR